jgi:glucose-1-phosphate adenylyltransferase
MQPEVLTMVLAGGAGERLSPLTARRCKPVVPYGGTFRVIDFTLLNCALSGLRRVCVLTQHQAATLHRHLKERWGPLSQEIRIEPLAPRPLNGGRGGGYRGTGDAIYQNLDVITAARPEVVVILSGDHVYRADYARLIEAHLERRADVSILAGEAPVEEASSFGVLRLGAGGRIDRLVEKPADPSPYADAGGNCPINLGIYCFRADFLAERLREDAAAAESAHDFGKNILPRAIDAGAVFSLPLSAVSPDGRPYWRDIGSLDSFFEGHMDLVRAPVRFDLRDGRWPAGSPFYRWAPVLHSLLVEVAGRSVRARNLIAEGARFETAHVANCVVGPRARVGAGAALEECILFPGAQVGEGAQLRRVIVEEGVKVPAGAYVGHGDDSIGVKKTPHGVSVLWEASLRRALEPAASFA